MNETTTELSWPDLIDAHLLNAAMEGAAAVVFCGGRSLTGYIDCADGFGEIAFVMSSPERVFEREVEVRYAVGEHQYRFSTRVLKQASSSRLRLVRPRRVLQVQPAQMAA